jgi:hypothetical protein
LGIPFGISSIVSSLSSKKLSPEKKFTPAAKIGLILGIIGLVTATAMVAMFIIQLFIKIRDDGLISILFPPQH